MRAKPRVSRILPFTHEGLGKPTEVPGFLEVPWLAQ